MTVVTKYTSAGLDYLANELSQALDMELIITHDKRDGYTLSSPNTYGMNQQVPINDCDFIKTNRELAACLNGALWALKARA